jgi:aminomethyltransferase
MSTNDVARMPAGTTRRSVLTNPIGRIIDVLRILSLEAEALLVTSPGRASAVLKWLQGYIFFQDDVQLSAPPETWSEWGIYGPNAAAALSEVFPDLLFPEGETIAQGEGVSVWRVEQPAIGGCRLLLDPDQTSRARRAWAGRGGEPVDSAAYQVLRIEAGLPEPVHEIRPESIPLEVGLREAISFTKGCYIGQEIIARMDSRGRQAHVLVGVRLSAESSAGEIISQAGREVGQLTSVARSPVQGWIALASVRPNAPDEDEGRVLIGPGGSPARLVRLPIASEGAQIERESAASASGA